MPLWPLIATLAAQTLATMALFSLPAIAPAVAAALHVPGELVGVFVSVAYGTGIISALLSPNFIHRYGGVRAMQTVLVTAGAMLVIAAGGSIALLAIAAIVLGLGYGAAAPASTHLLVPHTPPRIFNMVMSLRQIGVPLGGVLGSLLLPPLVLHIGWREALLSELPPIIILTTLLQIPRKRWDAEVHPGRRLFGRTLLQPFALLRDAPMRRLSIASFIYSGMQLSFIAFMTVQLTAVAGFDLIHAGRALATYQVAGAITRPIWGWIADRFITPGTDPCGARLRHGRGSTRRGPIRTGLAGLGGARGRGPRGMHRRRLHWYRLRRICTSRRHAPHRGHRSRHRCHVRRCAVDPIDFRAGGDASGWLWGRLHHARAACVGKRQCSVLALGAM